MQTGTQSEGRKVRGRKDETKQEAVTQPKIVKNRIDELVSLHRSAHDAQEALSEGIKKAAEDSGYNAAAVRKLVVARAGEKFEEAKKIAAQQLELFEEVGE